MFTFLDLLVVVFMVIVALALLFLCLMFLLKNKTAKRVFFYVVLVLGLYVSTIGLRIGFGGFFTAQMNIAVFTILSCIGAFVLERVCKGNDKLFLVARIAAAATLVLALANAFLI